jgi:hypothetical protein
LRFSLSLLVSASAAFADTCGITAPDSLSTTCSIGAKTFDFTLYSPYGVSPFAAADILFTLDASNPLALEEEPPGSRVIIVRGGFVGNSSGDGPLYQRDCRPHAYAPAQLRRATSRVPASVLDRRLSRLAAVH